MLIDYKEDTIKLTIPQEEKTSILRSQITFWKFSCLDDMTFQYKGSNTRELIIKLLSFCNKYSIAYNLSKNTEVNLQVLKKAENNFSVLKEDARRYKNGAVDLTKYDSFKQFLNDSIKRKLKKHQEKAALHLYNLGNGANFSVPGSGKTSVVLAVYEKLKAEGKVNKLLVVGPPSSFGPWKSEFYLTLGREPDTKILAGSNKKLRSKIYYYSSSELYLTTFQSLLYDQNEIDYFLNQKNNKVFLVIDEAHYIKQINGNWATAVIGQASKVQFRCILTGTPLPKSYSDIFNLFDFLWPFYNPISTENKVKLKYLEQVGDVLPAKKILDEEIGPLFYRVRKGDLKLKPQIFHKPYLIEMNKIERIIYDAIYSNIKNSSKKDYLKNIEFIEKVGKGRIMRLRQAISYPGLLSSMIESYTEDLVGNNTNLQGLIYKYDELEIPAKIQFLLRKVEYFKRKKKKIVIWSNFVETINLIEKHISQKNFYCKKIFGATPIEGNNISFEETREKIRDEFIKKDSGLDILIANPAACSESISLHKTCQNAIYYDLSYNGAQFMQSLDRIHRVGGSEKTEANYFFLQCQNTIDIDIKENVEAKRKKMNKIIDQDYAIYSLDMVEYEEDLDAYKRLF